MTSNDDYGPGLLAPYRVLDLTDGRGLLCGKMLADLGADVVQVEPPGGSPARTVGPFYQHNPGAERSLFWWAYCANKRGITLDIAKTDGAALMRRLVAEADFLIESGEPGRMASLGFGHPDLQAINPRLVVVSITAFGQDGPYADYQASDIVGMALGGFMHLTGDGDRPPLRVSMPQFYQHGSAAGAAAAMIAHTHRQLTGEGQHVDVSCQQAVARTSGPCSAVLGPGADNTAADGSIQGVRRRDLHTHQLALQGRVREFPTGRRHRGRGSQRTLHVGVDDRGRDGQSRAWTPSTGKNWATARRAPRSWNRRWPRWRRSS